MKLYHGTQERNIRSIIEEGFRPASAGDYESVALEFGINNFVFFSDDLSILVDEGYESIIEIEATEFFCVNGRALLEHEFVAEIESFDVIAIIHSDGEREEL